MILQRLGDTLWVEPEEDISFYNAGSIKQRICDSIFPGDRTVILSLSKVSFMDSAGLSILISLLKRLEAQGGHLILDHPQMGVQKFLEMTRLDQLIEIRKTTEPTTGSWADARSTNPRLKSKACEQSRIENNSHSLSRLSLSESETL